MFFDYKSEVYYYLLKPNQHTKCPFKWFIRIWKYVKKGTDLNDYTKNQLTEFQHKINERPREKLNFETPKNIFYKFITCNVAFGNWTSRNLEA